MNPAFIASCFLDHSPSREDLALLGRGPDGGEPILEFDTEFRGDRQNCLLYTSCHAFPLRHYLRTQPEFSAKYNINIILVHRLLLAGIGMIRCPLVNAILSKTSLILSHPFVGQYEPINLEYMQVARGCRCLAYVPPNNAALWPVVEHFGERGVIRLLERGHSADDIWSLLESGRFDCCYGIRWASQLERLRRREANCDIGISGFCERRVQECKLWFTENHPTYNLIAYIGSSLCRLADLPHATESDCVALAPDECGSWNASPETQYEWIHYGFKYPMRFGASMGGLIYYRQLIDAITRRFLENPNKPVTDGLASY